ncbi:unnamed protein product [Paramecium pentaurelia]|uniref:Uncharacterized protein n=1 Tax=Paramecium pentaurelia TaxID=43138 RepID=A0A8S1TL89_9CILI|nr:unnamed protein product [Paramecium pentaurelia]CAD8213190.1 unnamed protein product [Paramecium pentaurelia]
MGFFRFSLFFVSLNQKLVRNIEASLLKIIIRKLINGEHHRKRLQDQEKVKRRIKQLYLKIK